jgi:cell pole-organizing protein PopZ
MEEILASIRRIIEESDTGRPEEAAPQPVNSDVPPRAAIPEPTPAVHAGEEAELPPRQGIAVPPAAPRSYSSASEGPLAPMQSRPVERDASRPEPLAEAEMVKVPVESIESSSAIDATDALAADVAEAFLPSEVAPKPPAEQEFIAEPVDVASETGSEQSDGAMRPPAVQHTDTSEDEEVSMDLQRALEPILSETVERQVSASFDDLSFAVRSEQRRSFDEIAQEIMRPLLQEWLDNNLPTLVERLVREEIERVARGGRR